MQSIPLGLERGFPDSLVYEARRADTTLRFFLVFSGTTRTITMRFSRIGILDFIVRQKIDKNMRPKAFLYLSSERIEGQGTSFKVNNTMA